MKALISLLMLTAAFSLHSSVLAQDTSTKSPGVFRPSTDATYPGGQEAWLKYLGDHVRSEVPVKKKAPVGRYKVVVIFHIMKDGSVDNVTIDKDPGYGTAEEIMRVIKKSRKWHPAHLIETGELIVFRKIQSFTFEVTGE